MPERTDHNEAMRLAVLMDAMDYEDTRKAASLLRQQAERIAELEGELRQMTNNAADLAVHSQEVEAERDQLLAEVERMDFIEKEFGDVLLLELAKDLPRADMPFREAIDAARTTHKETE